MLIACMQMPGLIQKCVSLVGMHIVLTHGSPTRRFPAGSPATEVAGFASLPWLMRKTCLSGS